MANDGETALRKLREERPDLLLLDIMMPKLDGCQVCQHLKDDATLSSIPVVIISARGQESDKVKGFRAGACDYIVKPFDPLQLPEIVRKNLRGKDGQDFGCG
ncbi:response regulator [candidate division NPL-UPA2 bacterium]|nr:response regulator [candidate division NPL-UPA2 bacterium]